MAISETKSIQVMQHVTNDMSKHDDHASSKPYRQKCYTVIMPRNMLQVQKWKCQKVACK